MAFTSYTHSAQYTYIDEALRAQWEPFCAFEKEMADFIPRPREEFRSEREAEIERMRVLNPDKSIEDMSAFVDNQLKYTMAPDWQFRRKFSQRHTTQYVTVIMLSHALSEALINAVLAIGLAHKGTHDLFPLLERNEFKQKWFHGPKSFAPDYRFPIARALGETLGKLSRQRNSLVHLKIALTVDGETLLEGTDFESRPLNEERAWMRRFFSLPYDLAELVRTTIKEPFLMLLFDRKPIERASVHGDATAS